jgi:dihydroxy-acid dehydratase
LAQLPEPFALKSVESLRSQRWLAPDTMRGYSHRARLQQTGYRREDFAQRPVIAIVNTWSDISTCHVHLRERASKVREGIIRAGGFPLELPAMSLGEVMVKPTTMLYRNFLAMEVEELLRSHPVDGAVLMGGCDKTTPGLLMGAFSMNIPAVYIPAGATGNAYFKGEKIGTGTHTAKFWAERRAGRLNDQDWIAIESAMTRTVGTCNTMGTASTMTAVAEVLGMTLPGAQSIPAADSAHPRMCTEAGELAVQLVWQDLAPSQIVSLASFRNAMRCVLALGGSTNACVHLPAMAGRLGIELPLQLWESLNQTIPLLANLMPAGAHLMEDFYRAGGLQALLAQIGDQLELDTPSVNGKTLGQNIQGAVVHDADVIRTAQTALSREPAIAVLTGNLAPDGAIIKPTAASTQLLHHRGPALVFKNHADLSARIDDPNLNVGAHSVLVLQNAGPVGGPGMPEWGNLPIPKKLLAQGVRDMLRISDARMSGTHFGTCVLHVCPESAVGGPLSLVQDGDEIELNLTARSLTLHVSAEVLQQRREKLIHEQQGKGGSVARQRGYTALYKRHVQQAHLGADLDFLTGSDASPEPDIF